MRSKYVERCWRWRNVSGSIVGHVPKLRCWCGGAILVLCQVLDHLAVHKVLTVEHIYANPPRDGIERLLLNTKLSPEFVTI
jgi:hypothetical protein